LSYLWLKHNFRLTRSIDFERVRRSGKSFAHPLVVLIALPSESGRTLCGISASRSVGTAVRRNRAKRLLREAVRPLLPNLKPGWLILFLARKPLAQAGFSDTSTAIRALLRQARLDDDNHVG
jgi:ribonuclease P protein component